MNEQEKDKLIRLAIDLIDDPDIYVVFFPKWQALDSFVKEMREEGKIPSP